MIKLKAANINQQSYMNSHEWIIRNSWYICFRCNTTAFVYNNAFEENPKYYYLGFNYSLTCGEIILKEIME